MPLRPQHERETISKRTKDALAAKKARGAQLGSPQNFTTTVIAQGQAAMQRNAREHQANRQAAQLTELLRAKGQTLWQIAAKLNEAGYRTRRGKEFHATTVQRLLKALRRKTAGQLIADSEPVGQTTPTATVHGTIEASRTSAVAPSAAQIAATSARGGAALGNIVR